MLRDVSILGTIGTETIAEGAVCIERTLTGPLGTSLAVIAVAWAGFAMLGGRASPRRAIQGVLGAFILSGATDRA